MNYILKKETIYSRRGKNVILPEGTHFVQCNDFEYMSVGFASANFSKKFIESHPEWFEEAKRGLGAKTKDPGNQYNGKECELFKATKIINVDPEGSGASAQYELEMFAKNLGEIIITKFPPNQREEGDSIFLSLELLVIPQPSK